MLKMLCSRKYLRKLEAAILFKLVKHLKIQFTSEYTLRKNDKETKLLHQNPYS